MPLRHEQESVANLRRTGPDSPCAASDAVAIDAAFPVGPHLRMLANAGQAEQALAHTFTGRDRARTHTVGAKAYAARGLLAQAHERLVLARNLVGVSGATRYEEEFVEIEADLAFQAGDVEQARVGWIWREQRGVAYETPNEARCRSVLFTPGEGRCHVPA